MFYKKKCCYCGGIIFFDEVNCLHKEKLDIICYSCNKWNDVEEFAKYDIKPLSKEEYKKIALLL